MPRGAWIFVIFVLSLAMSVTAAASVRIGNFYYNAPNGIAFIKDDAAAFVIDPGGSYNAGVVAPDDSYHQVFLSHGDNYLIDFQWSRVGDAVVARLESQRPEKLIFKLDKNWPNFSTTYSTTPDGVTGLAKTASGDVSWKFQAKPAPDSSNATSVTLALAGPGKPAYFVAGLGELPSLERVEAMLAEARQNYEQHRPRAEGPSGDIVGAITNNLNNSRVYSNNNHLGAITVSRTFGVNHPNATPYFCWDSFFNGLMASLDNPESAKETVRGILSGQSADGLVPNFTHWGSDGGGTSTDRSQPPVGSMCIWKMHLRHPDLDFLREVYPKLALWHGWWIKARNPKNDGLLCWGTNLDRMDGPLGTLQGALWETGWDDTPHFRDVPGVKMVGHTMNVYAVDLNALWAMDAHYLALMADALGNKDDAEKFRQDEKEMNERINNKLWNEDLGIYCSRFWDNDDRTPGQFLTRVTPMNFYPLISGAASPEHAKRVLAIMTDPEQFWGEWIVPTVSHKDPVYFEQRYWHGTIWAPVNYLVFQGVKRYGSPQLQSEFAQQSVHLFMNNWLGTGQCGENFLSLNGRVGGNPNYTWGALMCLIGVESVVDINDDGTPRTGPGYNEPVTLENIPINGKSYRAVLGYGKPTVTIEKRL
jgi:glycogen debranching enzyme